MTTELAAYHGRQAFLEAWHAHLREMLGMVPHTPRVEEPVGAELDRPALERRTLVGVHFPVYHYVMPMRPAPVGLYGDAATPTIYRTDAPGTIGMSVRAQQFADWYRAGECQAQGHLHAQALIGVAWAHGLLPVHGGEPV
jgi:hypothetical protein